MIPQEKINEIRERQKIEDIGHFVKLKQRGKNLVGLCPFHNEKSPSFTVAPEKGFYKCFGCGKSGKFMTFIMEYKQLNFIDAVKFLADFYKITL